MNQTEHITVKYILSNYNINFHQLDRLFRGSRITKSVNRKRKVFGYREPLLVLGVDYNYLNNVKNSSKILTEQGLAKIEAMYAKRSAENT